MSSSVGSARSMVTSMIGGPVCTGTGVGTAVGAPVGVGMAVGSVVGVAVGTAVGESVGASVGVTVGVGAGVATCGRATEPDDDPDPVTVPIAENARTPLLYFAPVDPYQRESESRPTASVAEIVPNEPRSTTVTECPFADAIVPSLDQVTPQSSAVCTPATVREAVAVVCGESVGILV
jgi:hypothetical protein